MPTLMIMETITTNIRIVAHKGRYSLKWCEEDSDGYVQKILRDEVDTSFKSQDALQAMFQQLKEAYRKPIVHRTSANERLLGVMDD